MKIALASDLHLEFSTITLPNTEGAKVLILSGDILVAHALHDHPIDKPVPTNAMQPGRNQGAAVRFREFLTHVSQEYEHVVYVGGNHEAYHGRFPDYIQWLRDECKNYPNIHFLEMDSVVIDDITFVGGTLWTDMNKRDPNTMYMITNMMNDFRLIRHSHHNYRKFMPQDAVQRHTETLQYIKDTVDASPERSYVVVGHMGPSQRSVHARYKNDQYMNGGYVSDLDDFIHDRPQIKLWTLGHTHDPHSYYINNTFVACNPRGYKGHDPEEANFKLRYIDLDNLPEKFEGVKWSRD